MYLKGKPKKNVNATCIQLRGKKSITCETDDKHKIYRIQIKIPKWLRVLMKTPNLANGSRNRIIFECYWMVTLEFRNLEMETNKGARLRKRRWRCQISINL